MKNGWYVFLANGAEADLLYDLWAGAHSALPLPSNGERKVWTTQGTALPNGKGAFSEGNAYSQCRRKGYRRCLRR